MKPISGRAIVRFFVLLIVIYSAIAASWLVVGKVYAAAFCGTGNAMCILVGASQKVQFEPHTEGAGLDVAMVLHNRQTGARGTQPFNSRLIGFVPTTFLLALILATPLHGQRRWRTLAWALLFVHLYIGWRLGIAGVSTFTGEAPLGMYSPGQMVRGTIVFLKNLFFSSLMGCYLGPVFFWIIVAVRCGNFNSSPSLLPQARTPNP